MKQRQSITRVAMDVAKRYGLSFSLALEITMYVSDKLAGVEAEESAQK